MAYLWKRRTQAHIIKTLEDIKYHPLGEMVKNRICYQNDFTLLVAAAYRQLTFMASPGLVGAKLLIKGHYDPLVEESIASTITDLPITQIAGLSPGQSFPKNFDTIDAFSASLSLAPDARIKFQTEKDFQDNIKIVAGVVQRFKMAAFTVSYKAWDTEHQYFIEDNPDGTHHLVALYRQCKEDERKQYLVPCYLKLYSINQSQLASFLENYYSFIFQATTAYDIHHLLKRTSVVHKVVDLPNPESSDFSINTPAERKIVFLSKKDALAQPLSDYFEKRAKRDHQEEISHRTIFNLPEYLAGYLVNPREEVGDAID